MSRDLTTAFSNEISSDSLSACLLVKFIFDSGELNLWSGIGNIDFESSTFTGAGDILGVSRIEETQDLRSTSVTFTLNGLNSALIASALTANYQGRSVKMWFGVLDNSGQLIADPYLLFVGRMDVISFTDNGETSDFAVKCESNAIDIRKVKVRRYTPEDQKIDYPNDKGLDFIPKIQDIDIVWG